MMSSISCIACILSLQVDHPLLGAPRVLGRANVERALEWGKCGDREQKRSKGLWVVHITRNNQLLDNRPVCASLSLAFSLRH
jgi:hypothetical protein